MRPCPHFSRIALDFAWPSRSSLMAAIQVACWIPRWSSPLLTSLTAAGRNSSALSCWCGSTCAWLCSHWSPLCPWECPGHASQMLTEAAPWISLADVSGCTLTLAVNMSEIWTVYYCGFKMADVCWCTFIFHLFPIGCTSTVGSCMFACSIAQLLPGATMCDLGAQCFSHQLHCAWNSWW